VNNQYVGRTDANGRLFVPDLFPYSANDITLAAEDAPLDRQLIDAHRTIVPRNGAGVAIVFESRTIRAFTGKLVVQMPGGARKIPAAGTISLSGGGRTYSSDIGEDGAYYFENLTPGVYDALIVSALGRCAFRFDPGPSRGVLTRVGEQTCVVR
jgi:outer membrane usher protein FimD/PapC